MLPFPCFTQLFLTKCLGYLARGGARLAVRTLCCVTIYLLSMKNNDKSRRALTATQILGVQQNKYTLKNLVAIGNPEVNGYMLSNINTFNISSTHFSRLHMYISVIECKS